MDIPLVSQGDFFATYAPTRAASSFRLSTCSRKSSTIRPMTVVGRLRLSANSNGISMTSRAENSRAELMNRILFQCDGESPSRDLDSLRDSCAPSSAMVRANHSMFEELNSLIDKARCTLTSPESKSSSPVTEPSSSRKENGITKFVKVPSVALHTGKERKKPTPRSTAVIEREVDTRLELLLTDASERALVTARVREIRELQKSERGKPLHSLSRAEVLSMTQSARLADSSQRRRRRQDQVREAQNRIGILRKKLQTERDKQLKIKMDKMEKRKKERENYRQLLTSRGAESSETRKLMKKERQMIKKMKIELTRSGNRGVITDRVYKEKLVRKFGDQV